MSNNVIPFLALLLGRVNNFAGNDENNLMGMFAAQLSGLPKTSLIISRQATSLMGLVGGLDQGRVDRFNTNIKVSVFCSDPFLTFFFSIQNAVDTMFPDLKPAPQVVYSWDARTTRQQDNIQRTTLIGRRQPQVIALFECDCFSFRFLFFFFR